MTIRIGLVSDTHGLMRPEALAALAGCAHIVHAGDIGTPAVLEALARLAPVTAVRGNNDTGPWARDLPETATLRVGGVAIYVLHEVHTLAPAALDYHDVVVVGHSHRPDIARRGELLLVNPGSAGPRRFSLPITVAALWIEGTAVRAEIVPLEIAAAQARRGLRGTARQ